MTRKSMVFITLVNLVVAVTYWLAAKFIWEFFDLFNMLPAPIWPSAAIAVCASYEYGWKIAPGLFLGAFLANWSEIDFDVLTSLGIATMNTVAPIWMTTLLKSKFKLKSPFVRSVYDSLVFIVFGVLAHAALSASGGILSLLVFSSIEIGNPLEVWTRWWIATSSGILLLFPMLSLIWPGHLRNFIRSLNLEYGLIFLITVAFTSSIYFYIEAHQLYLSGLSMTLIIPISWVAIRFGFFASHVLIFVNTCIAAVATVYGYGPYYLPQNSSLMANFMLMTLSFIFLSFLISSLTYELKRAKDKAEAADKTKSEFLATMSHEIRTPMNAIMGMSELLAMSPLNQTQQKHTEILIKSSESLLELINDILDLSKIEAGHMKLHPAPVNMREYIFGCCSIMKHRAKIKDIEFEVKISKDFPEQIEIDAPRLRQILANLVSNAIKFTESGKVSLSIRTNKEKNIMIAKVKDTGIGLTAEEQEIIFDRFTQVDSSVSRKYEGTGLGLAITSKLVKLMGGQIKLTSTKNVGSEFTVRIPFVKINKPVKIPAQSEPPFTKTRGKPKNILIADDSKENLMIIEHILKATGAKIELAQNGAEAFDKFKKEKYDLVLMDISMPVLDGLSATTKIRDLEKSRNISPTPIVALTAHAMVEDEKKCLDAGCNKYLTKPFSHQSLINVVNQFFA